MMLTASFIFAIVLALIMGRYNKSNKLFWILASSFMFAFAIAKATCDTFTSKEQSEQTLDQAYPTPGLPIMEDTCMCFFDDGTTPVKVTSNLVGQAITPDYVESPITLSVSGVTQGIYFHMLPNPPTSMMFHDTS
jgi:hypothetical protein